MPFFGPIPIPSQGVVLHEWARPTLSWYLSMARPVIKLLNWFHTGCKCLLLPVCIPGGFLWTAWMAFVTQHPKPSCLVHTQNASVKSDWLASGCTACCLIWIAPLVPGDASPLTQVIGPGWTHESSWTNQISAKVGGPIFTDSISQELETVPEREAWKGPERG